MKTKAAYSIRQWPRAERPRERLLEKGAESLSETEIIAVLLRTGNGSQSAVDLARQVMEMKEQMGGWSKVTAFDLRRLKGIGEAKAAAVLAALELGRRVAQACGAPLRSRVQGSRQAYELCRQQIFNGNQESFMVMGLDAKKRVLGLRLISLGTLTQSLVHPREVFQPLVAMRAAGCIVAHNHPSGDVNPSSEDHEVTRRLRECSAMMAIPLIDHLILGENGYFSYADAGWRPEGFIVVNSI